jgi:hypothetical protein
MSLSPRCINVLICGSRRLRVLQLLVRQFMISAPGEVIQGGFAWSDLFFRLFLLRGKAEPSPGYVHGQVPFLVTAVGGGFLCYLHAHRSFITPEAPTCHVHLNA